MVLSDARARLFSLRYSRGFGIIGDLLGEDHALNMMSSIYGIAFYVTTALLGG